MNIVVDWDGTVTERDSLQLILGRFLPPDVFTALEATTDAALAARTMTHREVMEREFELLTEPLDRVVVYVREHAKVRPGFAEFVGRFDPLILSSSFYETIEPVLEREGITARLKANHAEPSPGGWRIRWTSDSDCDLCGEPCKRNAVPGGSSIYVGDGYSDRCAARGASRIFARDGLARYLTEQGIAYEPFVDFIQLTSALTEDVGAVPLIRHPGTTRLPGRPHTKEARASSG